MFIKKTSAILAEALVVIIFISLPFSSMAMDEKNKEGIPAITVIGQINSMNVENAAGLLSLDHQWIELGNITKSIDGRDNAKRELETIVSAFPDLQIVPKRVFKSKYFTLAQAVLTGTQKGRLKSLKPSGQVVQVEILIMAWEKDDEISRTIVHWNRNEVNRQIENNHTAPSNASEEPDNYELIEGKGIKVSKSIISRIIGTSAYAIVAYNADLPLESELNKILREEITQEELAKLLPKIRPYASDLPHYAVDIDDIHSIGDYVISFVEIKLKKELLSNKSEKYKNTPTYQVLLVSKVKDGEIVASQAYIGDTDLRH
jgi:predicted ester cyclase